MKQFLIRLSINIVMICSYGALALSTRRPPNDQYSRRQWLSDSIAKVSVGIVAVLPTPTIAAEGYDNPNMPAGPEERCKHIL